MNLKVLKIIITLINSKNKKGNFMKQIAIISDTHGILRQHELVKSDCCIHAGDINSSYIIESIQKLGEIYVVRGNNDKEWAEALPDSITVTIEGVRFFIVHNKKDVPKDLKNMDVVVYGHSHKYSAENVNGVLFLNPGSCGKRRFNLELTMCRMTVDAGHYQYEKVMIPYDI